MQLKLGITPLSQCSYLADRQEQLAVVIEPDLRSAEHYEWLMQHGFRRSGDHLYQTHCPSCQACESLRVAVAAFSPSRSQKRVAKNWQQAIWRFSSQLDERHLALYRDYINKRHRHGPMWPPNEQSFIDFVSCQWLEQLIIELYEGEHLVAFAVTDVTPHAFSAVYTVFDPAYAERSPGVACILQQLKQAQLREKSWLYLGFQIDECSKMNYKVRYQPNQRLQKGEWRWSDTLYS